MGVDVAEATRRRSVERRDEDEPMRERWTGDYDDMEENESDEALESGKHRSKDKSKSSGRREEKEHRSRDREKLKAPDNIKENKDSEKDRISGRDRRKEDRDERDKDKLRDKVREKDPDRKDPTEREKGKEREREKEKLADQEKDRAGDRDKSIRKQKDESNDMSKDGHSRFENDYTHNSQASKEKVVNFDDKSGSKILDQTEKAENRESTYELDQRISKMREQRLMKSSEGAPEILSWVSRSRKIEEKRIAEKEKALQLSRIFEEQDNMNDEESDDEPATQDTSKHLGGVKVLHGLDKVLEGGAVVLTLKDQSILADGDINEEVDMLENVEIGEQKRRDEAYRASKKKVGVYDDNGRFSGEAERKLEELRKRIQGVSASSHGEDLNSIGKISTDYYTQEEMTKFKKPKKKKSLRKKEKLDIKALEAEAIAAGLGAEDLGSRNDGRRQNLKDEQERIDAEMRSNAYRSALAKADEASKALRQEQVHTMQTEEEDAPAFGDDDDELRKSLERARKIALKKQEEKSGSFVIKLLSSSNANEPASDNPNISSGDQSENKVVFTEMEEFVWGLQLDEDEIHMQEKEEEVAPDETIHEPAVGKGLAATLNLLKGRGTLKETIEWGGRNMDKKKSKLVGIVGEGGTKEIRIERTDEYGRILTPKEAFRLLSHKFHGKGPGKMKQEKRMRQYQEELKIKQMKNADTPSLSVARMREAQAKLKAPYLVLSGHVKPGQSSDPRSGFATVEKDLAGGLTPMSGDKKVEHFLNIKRKYENEDSSSQKKPKT
ncbi:SART-1 family [Perilla frutescens var. hirtella]|uniref:SART-1 family n=1 Tax=Perilla frutescens var. hirtella TaxID=608512 RepID=A0AAD4J216_PERFH|nr:SART-1 family [Perilla frutescens var. hirtella]